MQQRRASFFIGKHAAYRFANSLPLNIIRHSVRKPGQRLREGQSGGYREWMDSNYGDRKDGNNA